MGKLSNIYALATAEVDSLKRQLRVESGPLVTARNALVSLQTALGALLGDISEGLEDSISALREGLLRSIDDSLESVRESSDEEGNAVLGLPRHSGPPLGGSSPFSAPVGYSYNSRHATSF